MARYTAGQLQSLWLSAGGSSGSVRISTGETLPLPVVMAAIALAESSGNASAVNPGYGAGGRRTREYSVGLWQINTLVHKVYTREQLTDPHKNALEAVRIYRLQGLRAWGAYTDGRYRQYLTASKAAYSAGVSVLPMSGGSDLTTMVTALATLVLLMLIRER